MAEAYIVDAVRTAGGKRGGKLAGWHPVDLAASVLDAIARALEAGPDVVVSEITAVLENTARTLVETADAIEHTPRIHGH